MGAGPYGKDPRHQRKDLPICCPPRPSITAAVLPPRLHPAAEEPFVSFQPECGEENNASFSSTVKVAVATRQLW